MRSDAGETLPEDHVGEILIHSDCMLDSYHNNWEETQRSMVDGWFKTGDLGFFHDGELYVTGRSKEMLIIGGENIYPQDIEAILNAKDYLIPGRNVAFGVENPKTGTERLVILAETRPEHMHVDLVPLRTETPECARRLCVPDRAPASHDAVERHRRQDFPLPQQAGVSRRQVQPGVTSGGPYAAGGSDAGKPRRTIATSPARSPDRTIAR